MDWKDFSETPPENVPLLFFYPELLRKFHVGSASDWGGISPIAASPSHWCEIKEPIDERTATEANDSETECAAAKGDAAEENA